MKKLLEVNQFIQYNNKLKRLKMQGWILEAMPKE